MFVYPRNAFHTVIMHGFFGVCRIDKSLGEYNTILSAYTKYRHLG